MEGHICFNTSYTYNTLSQALFFQQTDQLTKKVNFLPSHYSEVKSGKNGKQAGAELCQAQAQVALPAEAELILSNSIFLADFQMFKSKFC